MGMIEAAWDENHGTVNLTVTRTQAEVDAGLVPMRVVPQSTMKGRIGDPLPYYDYTSKALTTYAADVGAPLGSVAQYGLMKITGAGAVTALSAPVSTGGLNAAYLRDLFIPVRSQKVRVLSFDEERLPARNTVYAVSGRRMSMVTYDVRGGREGDLILLVNGKDERVALEELLADGVPVSLSMCEGLGNDPGLFAVGDVVWQRLNRKARWMVTLPLIEVDPPTILGSVGAGDLPLSTYESAKALLPAGASYDDHARRFHVYYEATWSRSS